MGHRPPPAGTGAHLTPIVNSSGPEPNTPTDSASKRRRNALILGSVFLFPILFIGTLFLFLRNSGFKAAAANPAIYQAQTDARVVALLGIPIQPGWPIRGKLSTRKGFGNADLRIPLSGPRGKGLLLEWAQLQRGKWHICSLVFNSATGGQINLVDDQIQTHCERE